jgi:putative N-acetyltransferase (TIGR04045 family)
MGAPATNDDGGGPAGPRSVVCRPAATPHELERYFAIRARFFVDNQHLFEASDVEPIDDDPRTLHVVAICQPLGEVVGVVRCYPADDGVWYGGRLAVIEAYRASRMLVGQELVRTAERLMQERNVRVFLGWIQLPTVRFFEHLGWVRLGAPVDYVGRPHQLMRPEWSEEPVEVPSH